ncbi:MAG: response regulator, partial [candidate division Zixibacteria bacterium]|nr:response regulator [candidate division Zixibacteria bacterium]
AHDFNNLLAPLIGYPDMIRDELPANHPVLEYVHDMEKSAHQIAEINQQLLTLGRRGHYNLEPVNLNEVVMAAVRELEPLPVSLSFETHLSQDLMNTMAGRAQLHRVLANLISNARDAMNDSGRIVIETENFYVDKISLAYGQIPTGEYVKLTVTDTGHGISDDIAQKIFDPFFTTKTSDKKRGSGLGLSVVDAVVKDHEGYIDMHTVEGKGTSFYLYFPITRETTDDLGPECVIGGTETVLVVDDDSVQREVSVKILKRLGYRVNAVDCGEKAIRFLSENEQDILLLDMIMPDGIDGTETYRRAVEISPTQKALILSGFAESERVQMALKIGAGAFIRKPLTRKTLADAVRKELDREVKVPVH